MSPLPASEEYSFCSRFSAEEAEEPLYATATRADIWLALEYTGRWGARAVPGSALSESVKAHLEGFQESTANVRLQFIRRPGNYEPEPIHCYIALAHETAPCLYAFALNAYEELLDLNLRAVADQDDAYDRYRSDEKLFFVCSNGLRDACCAKFGIPVYQAVAATAGEQAWQCTHIGGHRLAPNLLFLPHAVSYGRCTPEVAATLVESYRQGEVYLPHLRGRSIYDRPVQAALYFLREETGVMAVDAFRLLAAEQVEGGRWQVTVIVDGEEASVLVEGRRWPEAVYKSCSSTDKAVVEYYSRVPA